MALPDSLKLKTPRQPSPAVRNSPAFKSFAGIFIVLLTVAIVLFVAPFVPGVPTGWHWPLWIAAALVITATAPLRAWGLQRGLLSYYVHGSAVEGEVTAVERSGDRTHTIRYRYGAGGRSVDAEAVVYDSPKAPVDVGDTVPVLHREDDPSDSVLPTLAGLLPLHPGAASETEPTP
jgi:hypothetical protein